MIQAEDKKEDVEVQADGFVWAIAREVVPPKRWTLLGTLVFPPSAEDHVAVVGVGGVEDFEGIHIWCPVVSSGWLPLSRFVEETKSVRFSGPVPIWGKNERDAEVDLDVRFRFRIGDAAPKAPDCTPAYYGSRVWRDTRFLGVEVLKHPADLWVMQEILHEVQPDLVIETGTFKGGSALYYATVLDAVRGDFIDNKRIYARVVSIDVESQPALPSHSRITYLKGSSVDPSVIFQAQRDWVPGNKILVVLDSDHSYEHVREELRLYAPLVTPGSYIVVEDCNTPGPAEAAKDFLASPDGAMFVVDRGREKFGTTFNPSGYLRRRGES